MTDRSENGSERECDVGRYGIERLYDEGNQETLLSVVFPVRVRWRAGCAISTVYNDAYIPFLGDTKPLP